MTHLSYARHLIESNAISDNCGLIATVVSMEKYINKKQNVKLILTKNPREYIKIYKL